MPARGGDDDDASRDQGKGPLVYHESKVFNTEWCLCNVFDNAKKGRVCFEVYGLDTQETLQLSYNYQEFDALFRFNAALMNPNRKEGRFHWIIERLTIVAVGKDRKLQLGPQPTPEVPELPIYETERKIPTGRMDFKERQRLREQMDVLDVRRAENIARKRAAGKDRFLKHIAKMKEEDAQRKKEVEERIARERQERYRLKEIADKREAELKALAEERARARLRAAVDREERIMERQEEDYRQLRARWRLRDAEKQRAAEDSHRAFLRELQARRAQEKLQRDRLAEAHARLQAVWKVREERVRRKGSELIRRIIEVRLERQRIKKMQRERNLEYVKILHDERQPIFAAQLLRTEARRLAREAETQAVAAYLDQRSVPKKVKLKGKNAKKDEVHAKDGKDARDGKDALKDGKEAASGKDSKEGRDGKGKNRKDKDSGKKDGDRDEKKDAKEERKDGDAKAKELAAERETTERVLDAVEAKMRAEMEEQKRREQLAQVRDKFIEDKEKRWLESEAARAKAHREAYRQQEIEKEELAATRKLIMKQREQERLMAEERRKTEQERLQRARDQNIRRKEQLRLAALAAAAA